MKRRTLELTLVATALLAIAIALAASAEHPNIQCEWMKPLLSWRFPAYNDAIVNLAAGYSISVLFYFLVVALPEYFRRRRIRTNAIRHYHDYKAGVIGILLSASGTGWTGEDLRRLSDPGEFRKYFRDDHEDRWYAMLNGLNDYHVGKIRLHIELFREEIQYILNSVDMEDDELFRFLKNLSEVSFRMSKKSADMTT